MYRVLFLCGFVLGADNPEAPELAYLAAEVAVLAFLAVIST